MEKMFEINFKKLRNAICRTFTKKIRRNVLHEIYPNNDSTNDPAYISLDTVTNFDRQSSISMSSERGKMIRRDFTTHFYNKLENDIHSRQQLSCTELTKKKLCETRCDSDAVMKLLKHSCCTESGSVLPPPLRSPRQLKINAKKWTMSAYRRAKEDIYKEITFFYRGCLLVWCPLLDVRCDFVEGLLNKFGEVVTFHDRWIPDDYRLSNDSWGGVVAVYASKNEVKKAVKEIPERHGFIKTLELSKLMQCLAKSELKCSYEGCTEISVLAECSRNTETLQELEMLLQTFGRIVSYECYDVTLREAVLYEVKYISATHAFLAATVLDGLPFGSACLKVEVKVSAKERAILDDLSFQLQKFLGNDSFPFKGLR